MADGDFWNSIVAAHRVDDDSADRPILTPDPLESEPESDEEDRLDGVFSPQFVQTTGIHTYMRTCQKYNVVPVQQFIAMMDRDVVSLKHRGVGSVGGRAIFECLRENRHIQALDMEDNQLGLNVDVDSGHLEHISSALRENNILTHLDMSYNNLAARGCAAIAEALEDNQTIKELSLRGNNMGDTGAQALAASLAKSSKLTKLDLSDNGIGEMGGIALGALVAKPGPLKQADFSWNSVKKQGAGAIAEGLKTSPLVRLNLAWNGLGDGGAAQVSNAIKENATLQFLDLSSNRVGLEGATFIAEGLKENQTLRSLQINGNPIGDTGSMILIEAVGHNQSVRDLGLQDCYTYKSGAGLFDPMNPTGHYQLNLAVEFDVKVLERLRELDRMDEASGIDNFLNVTHNGKIVPFTEEEDIQAWTLPPHGMACFDYVSGKRVPKDARAQRDEVFQSLKRELANPALSEDHRLLMLRTSAITHYWNAAQVKQLVQLITYQRRVDAAVMLFRRTVDPPNYVDVVYGLLKPAERKSLRLRLGEAILPLLPESERALDTEEERLRTRGMLPQPPAPPPAADGEAAVVFLTEDGGEAQASGDAPA